MNVWIDKQRNNYNATKSQEFYNRAVEFESAVLFSTYRVLHINSIIIHFPSLFISFWLPSQCGSVWSAWYLPAFHSSKVSAQAVHNYCLSTNDKISDSNCFRVLWTAPKLFSHNRYYKNVDNFRKHVLISNQRRLLARAVGFDMWVWIISASLLSTSASIKQVKFQDSEKTRCNIQSVPRRAQMWIASLGHALEQNAIRIEFLFLKLRPFNQQKAPLSTLSISVSVLAAAPVTSKFFALIAAATVVQ